MFFKDMSTNEQLETPVLLIAFKRPETTRRVFEAIRKARPRYLYVVANGPRDGHPEDAAKCEEVRKIIQEIDWPCEFKPWFKEDNKGPRDAFLSAINWFFKQAEEGIILEDDCLPHPSFFLYCQQLLSHYRNDTRIMHISGNNFQFGRKRGSASYYFSRYTHSWGWATWRRAWERTDAAIKNFPLFESESLIKNMSLSREAQKIWLKIFRHNYYGEDSADALWLYTVWSQNGLSILPNVNLVSNIGFGSLATHTNEKTGYMDLPTGEIGTITHPVFVNADYEADNFSFKLIYRMSIFKKSHIG